MTQSAAAPGAKPHIICVGHAALDRIYRIAAFPAHPTKVRALEHVEAGGGMAANAAATIARLGGQAELWSRVGEDRAGQQIIAGLKAVGVDARHVQTFEEGRSSTSAIIVDGDGERLIVGARDINMPGGTAWLPLERVPLAHVMLADVRWLEGLRAAFQAARAAGVPTVLDAELGARDAMTEVLSITDYAIFSRPSLDDMMPGVTTDEQLGRVLTLGPRYVGVTSGAAPYRWRSIDGGSGEQAAFRVDVTDTTGAGDAFHGAFAFGLARGFSLEDCARLAAATAALKCRRLGSRAGLPTLAEVEVFLSACA